MTRGTDDWFQEPRQCEDAAPTTVVDRCGDNGRQLPAVVDDSAEPGADLICVSDVPREDVHWTWQDRFATGKLGLLSGNPDTGKSFLSLDISSRISRGRSWPDRRDEPNPAGDVILLSCEDGISDTIRPRLENHGADLDRIHVLRGTRQVETPERLSMFNLERDLYDLEVALQRIGTVKLIVIDPLSAYLGSEANSHKDADVRRILAPLAALSSRHQVCTIGIMHLNKGSAQHPLALHRIMGSLAFAAAARSVWLCVKDSQDETGRRRLFLPVKNNLAPSPGGLAYRIEPPGVVTWEDGAVDTNADESLQQTRPRSQTAKDDAQDFLREALSDGAMESDDVFEQAKRQGISAPTLKRAKQDMPNVKARKRTIDGQTRWAWMIMDEQNSRGSNGS